MKMWCPKKSSFFHECLEVDLIRQIPSFGFSQMPIWPCRIPSLSQTFVKIYFDPPQCEIVATSATKKKSSTFFYKLGWPDVCQAGQAGPKKSKIKSYKFLTFLLYS